MKSKLLKLVVFLLVILVLHQVHNLNSQDVLAKDLMQYSTLTQRFERISAESPQPRFASIIEPIHSYCNCA